MAQWVAGGGDDEDARERNDLASTICHAVPMTADEVVRLYARGKPIKVGIAGDSVARGYYAAGWEKCIARLQESAGADTNPALCSWANQLRAMLVRRNAGSVLRNYSVTSTGTYQLFVAAYAQTGPPQEFPPRGAVTDGLDIVFCAPGINDASYASTPTRCVSVDEFTSRYQVGINALRSNGIAVVLIVPNKIRDLGVYPPEDIARFNDEFAPAIREIAATNGLACIDVFAAFSALDNYDAAMYDEIHPNQGGHDVYFATLREFFDR